MLRCRSVLVAVVVLLATGIAAAAQPSPDERRERTATVLRELVERFTGPVDRSCGILWLDAASRMFGPDEAEVEAALGCVLAARRERRSTWAFWQLQGIDSTVFMGLATKPAGEVHVVHYDDFGGRHDMDLSPCLNPRSAGGPNLRIECDNSIRALSASELSLALAQLDDDVAGTAGTSRRGLAARIVRNAGSDGSSSHPGFLTLVVDMVQLELQESTGGNWPPCPRHGAHPLEFRDHRWFCVLDGAFLAKLGGLSTIARRPQP